MPDDTLGPPPEAPAGTGLGQWVKDHKWAVGGGGALAAIVVFLYLRNRAASSSSSANSTGSTPTGGEVYEIAPGSLGAYDGTQGYTTGVNNQGTCVCGGSSTGVVDATGTCNCPENPIGSGGSGPSGSTGSSGTSHSGSSGGNAGIANAYPVGTRVTSSETITQALYDPAKKAWLDLTSKGGIYGSGGNVSGSAYNPNWTGVGHLQLVAGGNEVAEYNGAGKEVGVFKVN